MIRLYIDNQRADMDPEASLSISLSLATQTSLSLSPHLSKSITIPATPHNRRLMECCEHPNSAVMFSHTPHRARVEVCGCVVLDGVMRLTGSATGRDGYYRFNIVGEWCLWRKCADMAIASMMEEWSMVLSSESIQSGWSDSESIVKFLPVERGMGKDREAYVGRVLPENYHPFIHLGSLLGVIFAKAGYAVESDFINSDFFQSLYMSGRWSERSSGGWKSNMDFRAIRAEDSPAVGANYFGRVFASPLTHYNTVGNLVDVPSEDVEGSYNCGCLGTEEDTGRLCFTPTTKLSVAFDYNLKWRTQYRIKSRTELVGLSGVRIDAGDSVAIPLHNNFVALGAEDLCVGYEYTFVVFDMVEGAIYRLVADEIVNPNADANNLSEGDTQRRVLHTTSSRVSHFLHSCQGRMCNLRVEMDDEGETLSPLSDWAVYYGFVEEYGTIELEASLRSKPVECSPSAPAFFDTFYFEGGEEGMEVTVLAGCSIQPVFYPHPMLGSTLSWRDVANMSQTGMDLIVALQELFDLQIVTDNAQRVVHIEPRRDYYGGEVVDLSECIDALHPVEIEELGFGHPRTLRLAYRKGDVAVDEYASESGVVYGEWSATLCNIFASEGERCVGGNLFTASLSESGKVLEAPSAHLILAQEDDARDCVANLNFPIKLVAFRGVRTLPSGEKWSFPNASGTEYPLMTFFDDGSIAGSPCSLLFEDRAGIEGLHKWWDGYVEMLNHSRRLLLHLHLAPEQIEALVITHGKGRGFGALYRLCIDGEEVLCRLEEICDYNPTEPSTRALFVTI